MFTFTAADIIRFYGGKLLFLPDNRQIERQAESFSLPEKENQELNQVLSPKNNNEPIKESFTEKEITPPIVEKQIQPITESIIPQKETFTEPIIIETPQKEITKVAINPFEKGEKIVWKIRKNLPCKLITIVSENELKNTFLMGALLFMMEDKCKIPRNNVSFGIYKTGQDTFDFSDMPENTAILFADITAEAPKIAGKKIFILPTLSKITLDIDLQEMSMKLLKDL